MLEKKREEKKKVLLYLAVQMTRKWCQKNKMAGAGTSYVFDGNTNKFTTRLFTLFSAIA